MTEAIRLAKRLIEIVHCSRREAELYIAGGWVMVDGQVVEAPQFMVSDQSVTLHPDASLTPIAPITLIYHQPPTFTDSRHFRRDALGGRRILHGVPMGCRA